MVEYKAYIFGIEVATNLRIKILEVYGDSALLISQVKWDWEDHDHNLIPYEEHVLKLIPYFNEITFYHIPREENQLADALATLSSMFKVNCKREVPSICNNYLDEPTYYLEAEDEFDGHPWFYDTMRYLESQEYPGNASITDKKYLRRLPTKFFFSGGVLYKRNYDSVLLRCIDKHEENWIIMETHEVSFGTHASGHKMVKKILRADYFWITMEVDCYCHVQTCHKCQIYADKIHVPPVPLNALTSPWPFSIWGIDVIGRIEPTSPNRHHFILVSTDYFTKWVGPVSYANVTKQVVARFLKKEIIWCFGVPNKIITDNAPIFFAWLLYFSTYFH